MNHIDLTQLKNKLAGIVKKNSGAHEQLRINPLREWITGIFLTVCLTIIGGLVSRYLYLSIIEKDNPETVNIPTTPYKAQLIESALIIYNSKQIEFERISGKIAGQEIFANDFIQSDPAVENPETATTTTESSVSDNILLESETIDQAEELNPIVPDTPPIPGL